MKQEIHWNILHEMEETKINFYIEGQASFPSPVVKYSFTSFTTTPEDLQLRQELLPENTGP